MFNNPILKHICGSYVHYQVSHSYLCEAWLKLPATSSAPFFCEPINRESYLCDVFFWFHPSKNSGDMKLKKPTQNFLQENNFLHVTPLLESLQQWLPKPMQRNFVERDVVVGHVAIVMLELLVGVFFNVAIMRCELFGWTIFNNMRGCTAVHRYMSINKYILCLKDIDST